MKFRRKIRVGRGLAIGAGAGFVIGAASGYAAGDDFWIGSREDGAIVAAIKKIYIISGNLEKYAELKDELLKFERKK